MNSSEASSMNVDGHSLFARRAPGWLRRIEALANRASDRCNPILVKEARQALKSKQFLVTFALLLLFAIIWSFLGVAWMTPGIYYAPAGKFMLSGYFWILAFPLIVIVPFSTFRSLAMECEDGTYELLTITTLRARQIIGGKLGSAMLQMVVYLSALSPCIAFTYLLRGVDIVLILFAIVGTFLLSVIFSATALLVATLTRARHWQVVLSVMLILALAVVFLYTSAFFTFGIMFEGTLPYNDPDFWYGIGATLTGWAAVLALVFLAAAARIKFLSDNRSTDLRVAMFMSHLAIFGWSVWFATIWDFEDAMMSYVIISTIFWWLMGSIMVGERPELSPRARRNLPASFLGRVCATWFQPGPGTGYLFAVSNMAVGTLLTFGLCIYEYRRTGSAARLDELSSVAGLALCYVTAYLGLGRIVVHFARRYVEGPIVACLINAVLLVSGVLVPLILQYSLVGLFFDGYGYTALQVTNPFWTFVEVVDGDIWILSFANGWSVVVVVLCEAAALMLVTNLVMLARDLLPDRTAVPLRVEAESFDTAAQQPLPSNPWE